MFSGCFVTLLIWAGYTTVVCLVDENLAAQPTTTMEKMSTEVIDYATNQSTIMPFGCGNNIVLCETYCSVCYETHKERTMECLSSLLEHICLNGFKHAMASLNNTNWCIWGNVSGYYSSLSHCTEEISDCLLIPWPNPLVEQTFVKIHSDFFKNCSTEEPSDPPPAIVFALVITPICLIPVMVSLVVLKTKNGDGSS
ncbi:hypothetical protein PAMP_009105 [Pampus punctatissimus]